MNISVASGKGGTGKTTVAVNLALSLPEAQFIDCDVEEPNSHVFIKPEIRDRKSVFVPVPELIKERCTYCGKCAEVCAYNAMAVLKEDVVIFPDLCHGCGACSYLCPEDALREKNREIGFVEIGSSGDLQFIQGNLNLGEPMAPPVIREIKKYIDKDTVTLLDAPPGTSCPVISTIKDSDFVILVTEATPFGLNDLELSVEVVEKLGLPYGVIINRSDMGDGKVEEYCRKNNIPVLLKIPFSREIAAAYSNGISIVDSIPRYKEKFKKLFKDVREFIK